MATYSAEAMRRAAQRCLKRAVADDDTITARSLLDSIEAGGAIGTADNIERADEWFNKRPRLPEFMRRYGD